MHKVSLLAIHGTDETVAAAAWASTGVTEITDEQRKRIPDLLTRLAAGSDGNSHESPLEFVQLHFHVRCDIATHIHLLKHRTISVNTESARYKEFREDSFYIPDDWPLELQDLLEHHCIESAALYHRVIKDLVAAGVTRQRAKESARYFLPYAKEVNQHVAFNLRSFMHFQKLRNAEHAQEEVQGIAQAMLVLVNRSGQVPETLKAFNMMLPQDEEIDAE